MNNIYLSAIERVGLIEYPNGAACKRLLEDNLTLFSTVQGSTHNHQNWRGGYLDHITEVMNIAWVLFFELNSHRPLPFTISDILLVVFLHDVEKPWKYEVGPDGQLRHKASMMTKADHQRFRMTKLAEYGITLTVAHENALQYAEGELNDYSSRERRMGPLAALAHMCDVASARIWFDFPATTGDPWIGAQRSASVAQRTE